MSGATDEGGNPVKGHEQTFLGVRNILYFDCDGSYTGYTCLSKLTKLYILNEYGLLNVNYTSSFKKGPASFNNNFKKSIVALVWRKQSWGSLQTSFV